MKVLAKRVSSLFLMGALLLANVALAVECNMEIYQYNKTTTTQCNTGSCKYSIRAHGDEACYRNYVGYFTAYDGCVDDGFGYTTSAVYTCNNSCVNGSCTCNNPVPCCAGTDIYLKKKLTIPCSVPGA